MSLAHRGRRAILAGLTAVALAAGLPSAAVAESPGTGAATGVGSVAAATVTRPSVQDAVDSGVASAADRDITQGVTVIDRTSGDVLASRNGDRVFNSESILKLFTAAYYLVQADGQPDAELLDSLRQMIRHSDDGIQTSLWRSAIVPGIVDRYGLTSTRNAGNASARNWGSGKITADDQARFLYEMSQDGLVSPYLMPWMAATAPTGSDGFNQLFGLNAMPGDHGSKQGWSDPGWEPYNIHSVGWTAPYFVAILQTSYTASSATMRDTSTTSATLITDTMTAATAPVPAAAAPAAAAATAPGPVAARACDGTLGWLPMLIMRQVAAALTAVLPEAAFPDGEGLWCASR